MSESALRAGWLWEDLQTASQRVKTFSSEGRSVQSLSSPLVGEGQQSKSQQPNDGDIQNRPKES